MTRLVRGTIVLPREAELREPAELIVQVEDVSRADAPSEVVGEYRLRLERLTPGEEVPFTVEVAEARIDPTHLYSIRAHVDYSGTGNVKRGDLITTQSYPVLSRGYGDSAVVAVKPV